MMSKKQNIEHRIFNFQGKALAQLTKKHCLSDCCHVLCLMSRKFTPSPMYPFLIVFDPPKKKKKNQLMNFHQKKNPLLK